MHVVLLVSASCAASVVGFETDDPSTFLDLVMELRESEARPYTLRDTPIFTCRHKPLRECLEDLG